MKKDRITEAVKKKINRHYEKNERKKERVFSRNVFHFKDELISPDLAKLVNKAFKKEIKSNEKNKEIKKVKK